MTVTVRPAAPADVGEILRMIRGLARYENEEHSVQATEAGLADILFRADAQAFAHLAELDGRAVGLAVWFVNFSTWTGRHGLYLEDLFVDETARRHGVARALFRALAAEAQARGCVRIDWAVLDWNISAMDFYRTLGARPNAGWQLWRLQGDALEALANP